MTAAVTRSKPPLFVIRMINPVMRRMLAAGRGRAADALLLLHLTGRKSGKRYDIPVGARAIDGQLAVLTDSPWRVNLRGGADLEVTQRGERRPMRAELQEDPEHVAKVYLRLIEQLGWRAAQRRLGIKIHVGRTPTLNELEQAVRESGLSIITLTPR
jgi:uncharacterized protein YbjT (DUF2867 family)